MKGYYTGEIILYLQSLKSKLTGSKSWAKKMDENLEKYELIREGL